MLKFRTRPVIPFPDFQFDQCQQIFGDALDYVVKWTDQSDLSALVGKPVRLCFKLREADVFSFRFY